MIKAVIFDIDGVLLDSFNANLKYFQDLLVKVGYPPPTKEQFKPLFHLTMFDVIKTVTKLPDEKVQEIWEMGKNRAVEYPHHLLIINQGVEETLEILSKKYILGIVTSRVKEGLYEIPALLKLKKYFPVTIAYEDTQNHKPHPQPLLLACEKLKINPETAIYVGDAKSDILAGKAAGMKTLLYSENKFGDPDLFTSDFEELPKLIKTI